MTLETNAYWIIHSNLLFLSDSNFWDKPSFFPVSPGKTLIRLFWYLYFLCDPALYHLQPQEIYPGICVELSLNYKSPAAHISPSLLHKARSYFFMGERIGKFLLKSSIHHFFSFYKYQTTPWSRNQTYNTHYNILTIHRKLEQCYGTDNETMQRCYDCKS